MYIKINFFIKDMLIYIILNEPSYGKDRRKVGEEVLLTRRGLFNFYPLPPLKTVGLPIFKKVS